MRDSFASIVARTTVRPRAVDCGEIVASPRANVETCEASIARERRRRAVTRAVGAARGFGTASSI
jgi:hypothetical protein